MMKRSTVIGLACLFLTALVFAVGCTAPSETSAAGESSQSVPLLSDSSSEQSAVMEISLIEQSEEISLSVSDASSMPEESEYSADESSHGSSVSELSDPEISDESVPEIGRTSIVTYEVSAPEHTHTGFPPLEQAEYTVKDADNERGLDTARHGFGFGEAPNEQVPEKTVNNQKRFDEYGVDALAWDQYAKEKVLYLTFDCGYQYEDLVAQILDILAGKEVPAAFFCTLSYLQNAPEDVVRMIEDGHIVGNHSTTHPSDSSALSREELARELLGVENELRAKYGYDSKYFRFPGGVHSQNALELADSVGYRSVFWSVAHRDWDPEDQPGVDVAFQTVTGRLHPGAVVLLHSTSPDNVAILADLIDYCRENGYTFRSLDDYSGW